MNNGECRESNAECREKAMVMALVLNKTFAPLSPRLRSIAEEEAEC